MRRWAFLPVAAVALVVGVIVGLSDAEPEPLRPETRPPTGVVPESPGPIEPSPGEAGADRLSLRQQVGQTIVLSFDGPSVPREVLSALRAGEVAGVVLFGDNLVSRRQLRSLTRRIQDATAGSALVAADQEGGAVRIVPFAASAIGQPAQTTPDAARSAARRTARDLLSVGVNVNLAPVADVAAGGTSELGDRAYPGGSEAVASLVRAAVEGYDESRVAATAKHFPGLGRATKNTDDAAVTIRADRGALGRDLEPFRTAVDAGVPLVMTSHALYPDLDGDRIASQSPPITVDLLRERLGFDGAVMTDSLEAEASTGASSESVTTAALRALQAGADLALTTGDVSYGAVFDRLLDRARESDRFRTRVEEAAGRVLELKRRLGLEPPPVRDRGA